MIIQIKSSRKVYKFCHKAVQQSDKALIKLEYGFSTVTNHCAAIQGSIISAAEQGQSSKKHFNFKECCLSEIPFHRGKSGVVDAALAISPSRSWEIYGYEAFRQDNIS